MKRSGVRRKRRLVTPIAKLGVEIGGLQDIREHLLERGGELKPAGLLQPGYGGLLLRQGDGGGLDEPPGEELGVDGLEAVFLFEKIEEDENPGDHKIHLKMTKVAGSSHDPVRELSQQVGHLGGIGAVQDPLEAVVDGGHEQRVRSELRADQVDRRLVKPGDLLEEVRSVWSGGGVKGYGPELLRPELGQKPCVNGGQAVERQLVRAADLKELLKSRKVVAAETGLKVLGQTIQVGR